MLARLKTWLANLKAATPAPTAPRLQIIRRDPLRVTFLEWRANPELTDAARKALADPVIRQMLDVMRLNSLGFTSVTSTDLEARNIHFSRIEGYNFALNDLESLAVFKKPDEPLESTFEDEAA